jgi:hypothetical protein
MLELRWSRLQLQKKISFETFAMKFFSAMFIDAQRGLQPYRQAAGAFAGAKAPSTRIARSIPPVVWPLIGSSYRLDKPAK